MNIHIAVITWNRLELTRACLQSLLDKTPPGYTLTIVDNASTDGTRQWLQELASRHSHIRLKLLARNMGLAVASNVAWDEARNADFYVKLDNDLLILDAGWLAHLVDVVREHPQVGMSAYRFCQWHQPEAQELPLSGGRVARLTGMCGGGCVCVPRATHARVGFWNEGYGRYGHEDQDYSWRVRKAGLDLAYVECDGLVEHRGDEPEVLDEGMEAEKLRLNEARLSGETAYHCNILLFDEGLQPLAVLRKYLPREEGGIIRFDLNPAYKPVMKLLTQMAKTISVDASGQFSRLDLGAWRDNGGQS